MKEYLGIRGQFREQFRRQTILITEGGDRSIPSIGFGRLDAGELVIPTKYNREKVPPAPGLQVRLSELGEPPRSETMPALIDTGGDFTTAPLKQILIQP